MTEHIIKLASGLPKGDPNGLDDATLAEQLWRAKMEHRAVQPRAMLVIFDVREAKSAKDGSNIVTLEAVRVQPVEAAENRRHLERIFREEYRAQTGASIEPFDVESVTKRAFADLPKTIEEIDAEEAERQDHMSPTDELRMHLERVHGVDNAQTMTAEEADAKHEADHAGNLLQESGMDHAEDWRGWTRADLEAAEAEADDAIGEDGMTRGQRALAVNEGDPYDSNKGGVSDADEFAADPPHEVALFRSETD